jgi:hypothetical protein
MKNIFFLISAFIGLISCESGINISVGNPSDFDRSEMVEIPSDKLMTLPSGKAYIVSTKTGEVIPSQLTYDGKLIFKTDINAKETLTYMIKTGAPVDFPAKTYGRFITERKDDFAWENDQVAFRIYGPALIEIDGPSNGLDFWYKRTNDLIIDKWYKDDLAGVRSYHDDHGEGLDDYKVGRTLGGGMMAPFVNDSLYLNDNFVKQEILENGPLRTTFKLTYKDITVDGKTFSESRTFSIDAGSQLTKITQEYGTKDALTVGAGIVKRSVDDDAFTAYTEKGVAAVIYEEPESKKAGIIFTAMVFPKGIEKDTTHTYSIIHPKTHNRETHSHVLGVMTYHPGQPITYYTGYGWNKFGFSSLVIFQNYISYFAKSLEEPLTINIL